MQMGQTPSSVVASGLVLTGRLEGQGNLQIQGEIKGGIHLEGNCVIEANGYVDGDVHARFVKLDGQLSGNLSAAEKILIGATGVVDGDIQVPQISIEKGALINGKVSIGQLPNKRIQVPGKSPESAEKKPLPAARSSVA